jgi:hypothetical protein
MRRRLEPSTPLILAFRIQAIQILMQPYGIPLRCYVDSFCELPVGSRFLDSTQQHDIIRSDAQVGQAIASRMRGEESPGSIGRGAG